MVKAKKEEGGLSAEEKAAAIETKRLRDLAISRGLLARAKANPPAPLLPTKAIRKCNGKDIVKKGHRRTKYLFAFPGLVAPVAGGKFGDLTNLDSRNPVLYIDFPQGRLKLFGTVIYPKNKYLTMHFAPGRGDIVCEDCFESLVVFPESWWIGTKEENPDELQLPFPEDFQQVKHTQYDFTAGAGRPDRASANRIENAAALKNDLASPVEQVSPVGQISPVGQNSENHEEFESPVETVNDKLLNVRHSVRNSVKKTSYAVLSSSSSEKDTDEDTERLDTRKRAGSRRTKVNTDSKEILVSLTETTHASKTVLKQGTLTSFLSKTTEVVESVDNPETSSKQKLGRTRTSKRVTYQRQQSICEVVCLFVFSINFMAIPPLTGTDGLSFLLISTLVVSVEPDRDMSNDSFGNFAGYRLAVTVVRASIIWERAFWTIRGCERGTVRGDEAQHNYFIEDYTEEAWVIPCCK
ncbi:hypothetical protein R1sor_014277 [Riccia sorocarpa]|uniref:DNA-binding protein RHL1 n=1 Tax=Riccia sorocarpa TaxID=122646 RepID=A0ABD3H9G7_9MARC